MASSNPERALLYRDGEFMDLLMQGRHIFWLQSGEWRSKDIDLREQVTDVNGQEILTSDKVSLRTNLIVTWKVTDPKKLHAVVADHRLAIYREAQLGLRLAIGERSLEEFLTSKEAVGKEITAMLESRTEQFGIVIRSVGLRDVILPGDMKTIMNQVMEANLIRLRPRAPCQETLLRRERRLLSQNVNSFLRDPLGTAQESGFTFSSAKWLPIGSLPTQEMRFLVPTSMMETALVATHECLVGPERRR